MAHVFHFIYFLHDNDVNFNHGGEDMYPVLQLLW